MSSYNSKKLSHVIQDEGNSRPARSQSSWSLSSNIWTSSSRSSLCSVREYETFFWLKTPPVGCMPIMLKPPLIFKELRWHSISTKSEQLTQFTESTCGMNREAAANDRKLKLKCCMSTATQTAEESGEHLGVSIGETSGGLDQHKQ